MQQGKTETSMTAESWPRVWEYTGVQKGNPEQLAEELNKLDGQGYREIVAVSLGGPSTACSAIVKRHAKSEAAERIR